MSQQGDGEPALPPEEDPGFAAPFAPDEHAPPVDIDHLRAYVRRELAPQTADLISDLLAAFRPWRDALAEVLKEEFAGRPPTPPLPG
jgi:hypothetical protein